MEEGEDLDGDPWGRHGGREAFWSCLFVLFFLGFVSEGESDLRQFVLMERKLIFKRWETSQAW